MTRRTRITGAAVTVAVVAGVLTTAPATAAPAPPSGSAHLVTLITGDRVRAQERADGRWSLTLDNRENGKRYSQFQARRGSVTDWYLMPDGAARLVSSGAVDRELFNITGLIRQGYDDARTDSIPLLAEFPERVRASSPPGGTVTRALPELNLASVAERKRDAGEFWRSLTASGRALQGPSKVWLNARMQASLDVSVPKVGAPAAWQSGFTGKGVTVAVLDTGADATHPDLAGKVGPTKDFSNKGNTSDGHGHGTHVAATVSGVGAKFKGVAPDATLAIGKVLDDGGSGTFDAVLAGMHWAAAEVKAKVINLSLGSYPTDGTDPVSRAVNTLSGKHGSLFVIAAGNFGADESVGSPATADAALAVGNTTKADRLSPSSSRGPRVGDGAVKPEIAAPGTDIVAAKAKGTQLGEPVGEHHVKLTGTSMATPHVAGGAALLAQQHPDWTGDRIKSALVSSAAPAGDLGAFAVGGGRLDLARATKQQVQALSASINAYLRWPAKDEQKRKLTYRNDGAAPVTLALDLKLPGAPAGLATLNTNTITVPAKGTADVELTATPRSGKPGNHGGVLVASTSDGLAQVRTPVAVHDEPEKYELKIESLDRKGHPAQSTSFDVINPETGDRMSAGAGETLRVAPGTYTISGYIDTPGEEAFGSVANPSVRVTGDTTVRFDMRKGKPVSLTAEDPLAGSSISAGQTSVRPVFWTQRFTTKVKGYDYPFGSLLFADPKFTAVYAYSEPGVSSPNFGYSNDFGLRQSKFEFWAETPERYEVAASPFAGPRQPDGTVRYKTVHGGQGTAQDLAGIDPKDKLVVLDLPSDISRDEVFKRIEATQKAGAKAIGILPVPPATARSADPVTIPVVVFGGASGKEFSAAVKAGGVEASIMTNSGNAHRMELSFPSEGRVPDQLAYNVKVRDLASVRTSYHAYDNAPVTRTYASRETPFGETSTQVLDPVPLQTERVEYFTPGTWNLFLGVPHSATVPGERITLEAGKSYNLAWDTPVAGPGFAGRTSSALGKNHPWAWRKQNLIDLTLPVFSDGAGRPRAAASGDTGRTSLYAGDKLVGTQELPGRGTFVVPRGEQRYRLTTEVARKDSPASSKVEAAWTFTSGYTDGDALPLLAVRYAPAADLRNRAPGGKEFTFPVRVQAQDAEITADKLEVQISYDDGGTWQPVQLTREGDAWKATVTHPASGFASLRAKASDADGNAVEQTIVRAYQIGG
ncbi:S8 family peptidase [Allokutzneria albata]|uniref:Serine protease, subtilisin family n=1 Tax=Allokutzneria albata TaxID=211114 RepID=A0A1G9RGE6_ALLAB|nr:S8 family serine peptidase [Allokutzneria albata]SDM22304.1 Serine protease, subtilisin family [Allokutzneria albata]